MSQSKKTKDAKLRKLRRKRRSAPKEGPRLPREVSDVKGMTPDQVVQLLIKTNHRNLAWVRELRRSKQNGTRPRPSQSLIGTLESPSMYLRGQLLDKVAELVDENIYGRSNMCFAFSCLLAKALCYVGFKATPIKGNARFTGGEDQSYEWTHAWVQYDDIIIDGNVDTMQENPRVPEGISPNPFWGHIEEIPGDRAYQLDSTDTPDDVDEDDLNMWWKDLHLWINANWNNITSEFKGTA